MRGRIRGTVLAVAASLGGCSNPLCTDVGCSDGVLINLSHSVPDSFTVSIETRDFTAVQEFPDGRSVDWVFFRDFTPTQGTVRVAWATVVVETTLAFEYRTARPNGEDCPPVCSQARVAIDLP